MSLAAQIETTINSLEVGETFSYGDLGIAVSSYATAAKALERLKNKGKIKRLSKGIFYKPEQSVFGELKPSDQEVIKSYLFQNGKRKAYITGAYLYNQMMLTRQVANTWKIATFNARIFVNQQRIKAKPVKAYASVTEENYRLLGFLDALKDWNTIPDLDTTSGIQVLIFWLKEFTPEQIEEIKRYALQYPPRVRAFLAALFEELKMTGTVELRQSLNPLSSYGIRLKPGDLSTAKNWNMI
jgi:hypothetical protein